MGPYRRPRPYGFGRRPHWGFGAPLVGGLLGGLVGSALFNPYFYGGFGYPYYRPPYYPYPYGGFWF